MRRFCSASRKRRSRGSSSRWNILRLTTSSVGTTLGKQRYHGKERRKAWKPVSMRLYAVEVGAASRIHRRHTPLTEDRVRWDRRRPWCSHLCRAADEAPDVLGAVLVGVWVAGLHGIRHVGSEIPNAPRLGRFGDGESDLGE